MSFVHYTHERRHSGSIKAQSNGYDANNDITEQSKDGDSTAKGHSHKGHFMGDFNGHHHCYGSCQMYDSDEEDAKNGGGSLGDGNGGCSPSESGDESSLGRSGSWTF